MLTSFFFLWCKAASEREGCPKSDRNQICTVNHLTESQTETKVSVLSVFVSFSLFFFSHTFFSQDADLVFGQLMTCVEPGCGKLLNNKFALNCVHCENWFHGQCVDVNYGWLRSIQYQRSAWICRSCNFRVLLAENEVVCALHLAFEFYDHQVFAALSTMGNQFKFCYCLILF
jgi:hypothetical protein